MIVPVKDRILQALTGTKGLTNDDLEQHLGVSHQALSPRVNELRAAGLVCDSGRRRQTRNGRAAIVWTLGTDSEAKPVKLSWKKGFEKLLGVALELAKAQSPKKRKETATVIRTIIARCEGR